MFIANIKVRIPNREQQQQFIARFADVYQIERVSQGCIEYEMYQNPTAAEEFFINEVWASQSDFNQHVQRAPFAGFLNYVESAKLYTANELKG